METVNINLSGDVAFTVIEEIGDARVIKQFRTMSDYREYLDMQREDEVMFANDFELDPDE